MVRYRSAILPTYTIEGTTAGIVFKVHSAVIIVVVSDTGPHL